MDPLTALLVATLMMLLNGGILGLVHRDLPEGIRPSAVSWRIGTLLQAGGCVLLAVQRELPAGFVLPLANGMLLLGMTGYWRALRQFDGDADRLLLLLPVALALPGIWWFANITPDLRPRVMIVSLAWTVLLLGCAHSLWRRPHEGSISRRVLAGMFVGLAGLMIFRMIMAWWLEPDQTVIDPTLWLNSVTPLMAAVLPVIGTTAYLLLCSDRVRRQWEHAASTDDLTGLPNRRTVARIGAQRLARAKQLNSGFAVALIDIDHFKSINDRFGHEVGDLALRHVAQHLAAAGRIDDVLGRQGGEEFVALLNINDPSAALDAAERLRAAVSSAPFVGNGGARNASTPLRHQLQYLSLVFTSLSIDSARGLAHWVVRLPWSKPTLSA